MKEYHIQLLTIKNAKIQFIQNKLTTFIFYVCRIQKSKASKHITTYMRSSSTRYIKTKLQRFRRVKHNYYEAY
jgi:hypothetical protein